MEPKKKKLFSSPRWHQDPGAVRTGIKKKLTEEEKEIVKREQLEWKEELKRLKINRKNTQK